MIELRLWQYARTLADHRSFARASRALRITQPALTRSIQDLERRVGVTLFERRREGIELTDAGQTLLASASALLARALEIESEIVRLRGVGGGGVVVGAGPYPADALLPRAIAMMIGRQPASQVRLILSDWMTVARGVRSRALDFGVAEISELASDPELRSQPLARLALRWVVRVGHPLLDSRAPLMRDLLHYPLVLTARIPPRILPALLRDIPSRATPTRRPFPSVLCEPVDVVKEIVRASDAVACLTARSVAQELRDRTLVDTGIEEPWQHTEYGVITVAGRSLSPAAEQLVRCVRAAERQITRESRAA